MNKSLFAILHTWLFSYMIKAGFVLFDTDPFAPIMAQLDKLEANIKTQADKANEEIKNVGKESADTKTALENLGIKQRELADELLQIKQKQTAPASEEEGDASWGAQFVKAAKYDEFVKNGARGRVNIEVKNNNEVKNTVTNAIGNTFSERAGFVGGAFRTFTIEDLLTSIPTSSNAIEWVRENVFTNAAAETAEGAQKPQSSITFTQENTPVQTVAHWIKITKQLAQDNAALAAYINLRMVYGVNLRVEQQLLTGNGTSPNLKGLLAAGNFTAHGYTTASLTGLGLSATNRFDLIGKMIGDAALADYPADSIVMNTGDWWTMRLSKDAQGRYLLGDPSSIAPPTLFGLPVVASNAMAADQVLVGALRQASTLHNRAGVVVEMFDQDENNAQLNLITIRAERRLALTVERPAAIRAGDLTPA